MHEAVPHDQLHGPLPVTELGVPLAHKLAAGASAVATPFALPQMPCAASSPPASPCEGASTEASVALSVPPSPVAPGEDEQAQMSTRQKP
jgi:hypothetical protein